MATSFLTSMVLLSSFSSDVARAEEPRTVRERGQFRIRTVDGALESEEVGDRGVMSIRGNSVGQTLTWEPAVGTLAAAAHHELSLVSDSARATRGRLTTDGFAHRDRVGGRVALTWTAQVDATWFVGTAVECPRSRVLLVTFGAGESTTQRIHRHSLDSLECIVR
jgi:hypothetical protein